MMENRVKKTIIEKKLIDGRKKEHIVLGLSGGPDSVCLFHVLLNLSEELNMMIHPVHINHKFRPGAAEEDQAYVEKLCAENGLKCDTFIYDCNAIAKEQGISGEEAGRNARYEAFYVVGSRIMAEYKIGPEMIKIAVAQNLNDQAETLLMRLLRGTGTEGLAGIEYQRKGKGGMQIIRPLLDVKREDIERYCKKNNLKPRVDHTNSQPIYTRNKIRLGLIPYIEKEYNPNVMDALNRLSIIAKEDKEFMDSVVEKYLEGKLKQDIIKGLHPAIRKRIVMRRLEKAGLEQGITWAHMEAADKIVMEGKTGTSINLPKGFQIKIDYGEVIFSKSEMEGKGEVHLNANQDKRANQDKTEFSCAGGLTLRTRRAGDYIILKGVGGRKKIQDAFVDMKVKREQRDSIPLLCRKDEVMWILGDDITGLKTGLQRSRTSENYVVDEETRQRIIVEFNKKI